MHISDSELITAIIDGEIHRYGEVVQRFDNRVRQSISRKVTDPAAIEDLVQETFYKAFLNFEKLQDVEKLEGWLIAISKNCVADHFRKLASSQLKQMGEETIANSASLSYLKSQKWIWDEVEKLTDEHARVLSLRYRFSMTYEEIATQLGIRESTVRGRIFEARKSLKKRLSEKRIFP